MLGTAIILFYNHRNKLLNVGLFYDLERLSPNDYCDTNFLGCTNMPRYRHMTEGAAYPPNALHVITTWPDAPFSSKNFPFIKAILRSGTIFVLFNFP